MRTFDRQFWLAVALAAVVMIPRSWLISRAHSECVDAEYHLDHGLCAIRGEHPPLTYNDPPLGEALMALPLYLAGCRPVDASSLGGVQSRPLRRSVIYGQPISPELALSLVAVWKAVLFLPAAAVVFHWCRQLYGLRSAWLALALLLIEPTIAAHVAVAALDSLAMGAAVIAAFFGWQFIERPTARRAIVAGLALSAALLIKHSCVLLPPTIVLLALLHWNTRAARSSPRAQFNALALLTLATIAFLWPLTLFNFSAPTEWGRFPPVRYDSTNVTLARMAHDAASVRWPAGIYLGSLMEAVEHARDGHPALLWGEYRTHGWRYYFLAVALYKVPVGIAIVLLLGAVSLAWKRVTWSEVGLIAPMFATGVLIVFGGINIGFRHALPCYVFLLMLSTRCLAAPTFRFCTWTAWIALAAAAVHVSSFHPDYLSYINGPWRRPYLAIGDSNIDWGQATRQIATWLDRNPQYASRTIHYDDFDDHSGAAVWRYLGDRVRHAPVKGVVPSEGILIVSPAWIAGLYDRQTDYAALRYVRPIDTIGHSLLVYDLDALPNRPGR